MEFNKRSNKNTNKYMILFLVLGITYSFVTNNFSINDIVTTIKNNPIMYDMFIGKLSPIFSVLMKVVTINT